MHTDLFHDDVTNQLEALGPPSGEFRVSGRSLLLYLLVGFLLILVGGLVVWLFVVQPKQIKMLFFGIVAVVMGCTMIFRTIRNRGLLIIVYPEGLMRFRGAKVDGIFWDEVHALWRKKSTGFWSRIVQGKLVISLERRNGPEIEFDQTLNNLTDLGLLLQQLTLPHLASRYRSILAAGGTLDFGELVLTPGGIRRGKETLTWNEVAEVEIKEDQIVISKKGKWLNWYKGSTTKIPNLHVLRALIPGEISVKTQSA